LLLQANICVEVLYTICNLCITALIQKQQQILVLCSILAKKNNI